MRKELELSALGHTWVIDLDGTIVKHNGYKIDGEDSFLPGAEEFLRKIPLKDMLVFITSREECCRDITETFLNKHHIKYNYIIWIVHKLYVVYQNLHNSSISYLHFL